MITLNHIPKAFGTAGNIAYEKTVETHNTCPSTDGQISMCHYIIFTISTYVSMWLIKQYLFLIK